MKTKLDDLMTALQAAAAVCTIGAVKLWSPVCGSMLELANGIELLIHVGIDTVSMNGDGFALHVKEGDRVKRGDKLITFDPEKIKAAGHPTITAFLVTEPNDFTVTFAPGGTQADAAQTAMMHYSKEQ